MILGFIRDYWRNYDASPGPVRFAVFSGLLFPGFALLAAGHRGAGVVYIAVMVCLRECASRE